MTTDAVTADAPTVANLCSQFHRVARRFAIERARLYPHLTAEFESRANYACFTGAKSYVAGGPELWANMRFVLYLKICTARACDAVVAKERTRHPIGFEVHGDREEYRIPDREPLVADAVADADELWNDIEDVLPLLDGLSEKYREWFVRHHAEGDNASALAREYGVHPSTVSYALARSMVKVLAAADLIKN